ncbi:cytochrome o ubiquinol oxidase subunit IV [Methylobacterium sp. CM6257]
MRGQGHSRASVLLKAAGAVAVLGTSRLLFGGDGEPDGQPRRDAHRSREPSDDGSNAKRGDLITYGVGYVLALLLTCAAFALVHWHWATSTIAPGIIFALALVQAIVHFRCFLHIDLKQSARDDLQLILFSTLIIAVMVGGSLIVLFNQRMRMM